MSARGVTAQELPENTELRYTVNEQTGEATPWDAPAEDKPKRRGRLPKAAEEVPADEPAEGEGE